jgi:hypothetical protein
MRKTGVKIQCLLCFWTVIVIVGYGLIYIIYKPKGVATKTANEYFTKLLPSFAELCSPRNGSTFRRDHLRRAPVKTVDNTSAYVSENDASTVTYIPRNYSDLTEFIANTRASFMSRRLIPNSHSIRTIFRDPPYKDMVVPSCDGLWMEFGVFRGDSLRHVAKWKAAYCGNKSQPVYGFDTFSGLPTDWRPGFGRGTFAIPNEKAISVPSNTVLVKGLFIDTLPTQLRLIDREYQCNTPVAFVHIDCDIYDGARDVLFLLGSRFVSGSILVFDELFNYPGYDRHEIKALYEFMSGSKLRLAPLGTSGNIELNPTRDQSVNLQSFALIIDAA